MKSYIQGLITGVVLVFAIIVMMGASDNDNGVGRYQISSCNHEHLIFESTIDTKTGEVVNRNRLGAKEFNWIK